jgi:hypothetical protein
MGRQICVTDVICVTDFANPLFTQDFSVTQTVTQTARCDTNCDANSNGLRHRITYVYTRVYGQKELIVTLVTQKNICILAKGIFL